MIKRLIVFLFSCIVFGHGFAMAQEIKDGVGKAKLPDSSVYEGEFKNGVFNGKGTLTYANGDKYSGEFKDGLIEGQGIAARATGGGCKGEYQKGDSCPENCV